MRVYAIALFVILLLSFLPMLCVWLITSLAEAAGCSANLDFLRACQMLGYDVGQFLTRAIIICGLLLGATLPLGVVALSIWLLMVGFELPVRYIRKRDAKKPPV